MPDKSAWRWTWLMAFIATATLEIAADDGESPLRVALTLVLICLFVVAGNWSARHWLRDSAVARHRMAGMLAVAGGALCLEMALRLATRTMLPLELLLLAGFRNAVLVLAIFAHEPEAQRRCGVMSTFLLIFASSVNAQWWIQGLVILFAVVGIWWLMESYWNSLSDRLVADSSRELPRQWWLLLPLVLAVGLFAIPFGSGSLRAMAGFMPSSGGSDWYSEAARSGVGDGDALIAGTENIRSFAPIEDAPFLSSHEPSLYDLFDDTYNEPVKTSDTDRAIPLPKELGAQQKEHHLAQSQQAGRQFSTLREIHDPRQNRIKDRFSTALFHVKGRTPLHLKLQTFQAYDGVDWHPDSLVGNEPALKIETRHGRPWLRPLLAPGPDIYSTPETHALQIIHLDTNRIPTPTQLTGVHIDRLDRADFFAWAQPGIVRMEREKLPAQTAIHVQSRCIDAELFESANLVLSGRPDVYQQFGDDPHSRQVRELARRWTEHVPYGWPQIAAVVRRLREEYVLDATARPPQDCRHTVAHFLLEARRGPDYQFASAAVWLLRSLGYSSRLVSGFYVHPLDYEARSRQTPVAADDVHFWVEVYAGRDHWLPLEPTPGYELLSPPLTWSEQFQAGILACGRFLLQSWWWILPGVAAMAWALVRRHFLADFVATLAWRSGQRSQPRRFVLATRKLLEARLRRAGMPKPPGQTFSRWLSQLARSDSQFTATSGLSSPEPGLMLPHSLASLLDWADFAPADARCPDENWSELCVRLEQEWSWPRLVHRKQAAIQPPPSSKHLTPKRPTSPLRPLARFSVASHPGSVG